MLEIPIVRIWSNSKLCSGTTFFSVNILFPIALSTFLCFLWTICIFSGSFIGSGLSPILQVLDDWELAAASPFRLDFILSLYTSESLFILTALIKSCFSLGCSPSLCLFLIRSSFLSYFRNSCWIEWPETSLITKPVVAQMALQTCVKCRST